jgi:Na+-transporting methylmalonyl-CoA/oxaloacetate decarboxylase gamma subunit
MLCLGIVLVTSLLTLLVFAIMTASSRISEEELEDELTAWDVARRQQREKEDASNDWPRRRNTR